MPADPDHYLRPLIGYLQWRLREGRSVEQALADAAKIEELARFDAPALREASGYAWRGWMAQRRYERAADKGRGLAFYAGFGGGFGARIGVRVAMTFRFAGGGSQIVSVTVNASPEVKADEIIRQAVDYVNAGNLQPREGKDYEGEVDLTADVTPDIFMFVQGGFGRPSFSIT